MPNEPEPTFLLMSILISVNGISHTLKESRLLGLFFKKLNSKTLLIYNLIQINKLQVNDVFLELLVAL